jgi:hypothetical protein
MLLTFDEDVKALAAFVQSRFPARRLVGLATALSAVAPAFWGAPRKRRRGALGASAGLQG